MEYFIVICIAGSVSYVELLSRYNKPLQIITRPSSLIYMVVNAISGAISLSIIQRYGIIPDKDIFIEIATASTGSLFILRSSVSKIKGKNGEVFEVGFSSIIDVLLKWSEREFDRISANGDLDEIYLTMKGFSFDKIYVDLPEICLDRMESVNAIVIEDLAKETANIGTKRIQYNTTKSILLGNKIASIAGINLLKAGAEIMKEIIANSSDDKTTSLSATDLEKKAEQLKNKFSRSMVRSPEQRVFQTERIN